jgi:hypothetical protein
VFVSAATPELGAQHLIFSRPMTGRERVLLVFGFAALLACRIPGILPGRFWAEDGEFFLDALRLPWHAALTTPHTGYLNLVASLSMQLAARLVPLEFAPLASCVVALILQTLPAILLVTSRISWLQQRWQLVLALLLIATPPLSEEVWISPMTIQYHLMLCVGLILAEAPRRGIVGVLQAVVLVVAPLAGPGNSFAIPLFALRTWLDQSWARVWQTLLLSVGTVIQLGLLVTHPQPGRHLGIELPLLLAVICVKHLLVPLLGRHEAVDLANRLPPIFAAGGVPVLPVCATLLAGAALIAAVWYAGNRESRWLTAAGGLMMVLAYFGAFGGQVNLLGVHFGMRYALAPQDLFGLALIGVASTAPASGLRSVAGLLVLWLVFVGVHEYFWVSPAMAHGPSWRAQVIEWRSTQQPIHLWPPNFVIRLPDRIADE